MNGAFEFKNKLLVLRLNRLQHTPPALYGTQILKEEALPVLAFEFSEQHKCLSEVADAIPTRKFGIPLFFLPRVLRATVLLVVTFLHLIIRFKKEGKPKFILTHGLQEEALAFGLKALFGIRFASHVHEVFNRSDLRNLNRVLLYLEKFFLRHAEFTVFPTDERSDLYKKRYNLKTRSYTVFNTPRRRSERSKTNPYRGIGIAEGTKTLLFMGGMSRLTVIKETIEALTQIPEPLVLVLAGWGDARYVRSLHELVEQKSLKNRVRFLGPVSNKWEWIDHADLGLCLYAPLELRLKYAAGASNKLFEFISAGVPVITNNAEDFRRIVLPSQLGVCVETFTPTCIADGIRMLLHRPSTLMASNQRNAIELHHRFLNYEKQFHPITQQIELQLVA